MTKNFWQGKKVRLRGIEPPDAELFIRWNLDSERARHLDFVWPPLSQSAIRSWVEEQSKKRLENDAYYWMIETLAGVAVGGIDTHHCNAHDGTFGYGIDVAREHQRLGYASEAIMIVLRYYFQELRYQKVTVPVHSNNPASVRLHEKLGFRLEGTLRRMFYTQGEYVDEYWFGLTKEEFLARA